MAKVDLTKYFCEHPFIYSEFHRKWDCGKSEETQYICCPDWNDINIRESDNLHDNWHSKTVNEIREGHLTGNFKGCNPVNCPAYNTLLNTGKPAGNIKPISEFDPVKYSLDGPRRIKICSDDACNFKCPTCRTEIYPNTPEKTARTNNLFDSIREHYGSTLKEIYVSGGGDPFYSVPMRNFLTGFKQEDFPEVESVILHTNASLWTPKLWEQMVNIHPHVKLAEISIDAATKETYETKTRIGGKWDVLMQNLEFIKTIDTIETIMFSYVVQQNNFREMDMFVELIDSKFKDSKIKQVIQFQKVVQWPSISDERYKLMKIWEPEHPEYNDFVVELKKINRHSHLLHNLNEHDPKENLI
mgnify:CR=1 FL=1